MESDKQESFLELAVIWKDYDMLELRVTATNGKYFGTTEVYDTRDSLINFANSLTGYPKDDIPIMHKAGEINGYAYFSMQFYLIGDPGHVGVQISLEENVATYYRQEEKSKLVLEIIVEPGAIDNFQKELLHLVFKGDGKATLYGRRI